MRTGLVAILAVFVSIACAPAGASLRSEPETSASIRAVVEAARGQVGVTTVYDPAYVQLAYPGGDVSRERGVCTDVVIRAFRAAGVDLQQAVHEDMRRSFSAYPKRWGLSRPDPNIDHRRVPNLMVYFARQGKSVAISADCAEYLAGDVVSWDLGGGVPHIGVVTTDVDPASNRPLIVHNIGQGARLEDVLFSWKITGHYRYFT